MTVAREAGGPVALRASLLHSLAAPTDEAPARTEYIEDALLVIEGGRVARVGEADELLAALPPGADVVDHRGRLVLPGFIDAHVHFPQTDIVASYGRQLLEWLETYTFPAEARFADPAYARETAGFFVEELLRNGTTSALVLGTVHAHSADAILEAARARGMRLIAGKVLMDRNCPVALRDTPESAYRESSALIERWHGVDRLGYAITPRFAPTSSEAQLEAAGRLAREHPEVHVHTHLAENLDELRWVASLFPEARSYLDVYRRYGLLRERAVFAHCIHLDDEDRRQIAASGATMAFCPSANTFLGSGLFDLAAARAVGARVALGTDVGAGTSLSLLATLAEAYKVTQLAGHALAPADALYLATLGTAEGLGIDGQVGNLAVGKEADFVVVDEAATPLLARRMAAARDWRERLFALIVLGDDRAIAETWIGGVRAYRRDAS